MSHFHYFWWHFWIIGEEFGLVTVTGVCGGGYAECT